MKNKCLRLIILSIFLLNSALASAYESFSHTTLILPHEPSNLEAWVQIITSQEEWESFFYSTMATITYPAGEAPVAPLIDFETYQVITGGLGMKPTSGYSLAVEKVIETDDVMNLNIISVSPVSSCLNLQVISYPTLTLMIKKTDKDIKYNITSVVNKCE